MKKLKDLKIIPSIKIGLLIINILIIFSCDEVNSTSKGILFIKIEKEDSDKIGKIESFYVLKDSIYKFHGNKITNRYFGDKNHEFYNKSPYDYELKDSIFNIFLSKQINLKQESDYIYVIGNNNFYKQDNNLFICLKIDMLSNIYNTNINFSNPLSDIVGKSNKEIVLDSLISLHDISNQEIRKYNLIKQNIKNIEVHFLINDIELDNSSR